MSRYQFTFHLQQITPMIHFQWEQEGATLRATEVKPKLDRFIVEWCQSKGIEIPQEWYIDQKQKPALKYKMRIEAKGKQQNDSHCVVKDGKCIGEYFTTGQKVNKSSFFTAVELHILCFCPELMEKIKECFPVFLVCNNFGFRQNKGFGSFWFQGNEYKYEDQLKRLIITMQKDGERHDRFQVYKLDMGAKTGIQTKDEDMLNQIRNFYQEMKSGINFNGYYKSVLMKKYMLAEKGIGNEKKRMKCEMIHSGQYELNSSAGSDEYDRRKKRYTKVRLGKECTEDNVIGNTRYVRGVLGFAGHYEFPKTLKTGTSECGLFSVKIFNDKENESKIKRFSSPVYFKPFIDENGNCAVYIFLFGERLKKVQDKNLLFQFSDKEQQTVSKGTGNRMEPFYLKLPTSKEFDLYEFFKFLLTPNIYTKCKCRLSRVDDQFTKEGVSSV